MPAETPADLLQRLPRLWAAEAARDLSDGELLERFLARREETAFAILVQRHGPMVLGAVRRVLADAHHAEDAFQAVFLVLARRAAAIRKRASLANWLHGVARRIALRARAQAAAQRHRERRPREMPQVDVLDEVTWRELRAVLDEEVGALPERHRAAVVLCDLEGKSYDQAARELGWPKSSLASRLAKAHGLLRARLVRRGVTLSAGALATGLAGREARAAVPALLTIDAVKGAMAGAAGEAALPGTLSERAVALAEGAMKGTFGTKSKAFAVLAALALLVGGVGLAAHQGRPGEGGAPAGAPGKAGGAGRARGTRLLVTVSLPDVAPGKSLVLAIDPETGAWEKVAENQGPNIFGGFAAASPDGKTVLFVRGGVVYGRAAVGAEPKKLCEPLVNVVNPPPNQVCEPGVTLSGPLWSRDGKHFYVTTRHKRLANDTWNHETWRYDADGRNSARLKLPSSVQVQDLSPDGKRFLTNSQTLVRQQTMELGLINTDGTGYRRLSEEGGFNGWGRFSPDGRRVAYVRYDKDIPRVEVVGVNGEGRKKVFGAPGTNIDGCCWSPDGKRLAVLARDFDGKQIIRRRIELMGPDGRDRRVVPLKAKVEVMTGPDWYAVAE
jgi:RNA polymerase sigma factor (sigma-70 family)